jgi:hypothetical protein
MKILYWPCLLTFSGLVLLGGCQANQSPTNQTSTPQGLPQGLEIKFLVGSALTQFCEQAATQFNQQNPKLDGGQPFNLHRWRNLSCPVKIPNRPTIPRRKLYSRYYRCSPIS